jgi:hypothetical protein
MAKATAAAKKPEPRVISAPSRSRARPNDVAREGEAAAVWVDPRTLKRNPKNPRRNDAAVAPVARAIEVDGFGAPIVARLSNRMIIAGDTRWRAAVEVLDLPLVPVRFIDVTQQQFNRMTVGDNRLGEFAEWDDEKVLELLQEMEPTDQLLAGYGPDDIGDLLAELQGDSEQEVVEDEVPEPPKVPVTKPGDVWLLGRHRLVCGDSTAADVMAAARSDAPIDMVFADPPYGMHLDVRYDAMHNNSGDFHHRTGDRFEPVLGDDRPFDPSPLIALTADVREQLWWGADYYRLRLPEGGSWYVWDKRHNESGMELDAVLGSHFELCWSRQSHRREIARVLWSGHWGMQGADKGTRVHPTQKPVALVAWFAQRLPMQCILDPFMGSGTTLIAAEQLGRRCFGIELSPAYCDVIVERWQNLTGEKAKRA